MMVAAALARKRLLQVAAIELGDNVRYLTTKAGEIVSGPGGTTLPYGALAEKAATATTRRMSVTLKPRSKFTVIGKPHNRIDALDAVTGRKRYGMDLEVPGAKPTMICRAPQRHCPAGPRRPAGGAARCRPEPRRASRCTPSTKARPWL